MFMVAIVSSMSSAKAAFCAVTVPALLIFSDQSERMGRTRVTLSFASVLTPMKKRHWV